MVQHIGMGRKAAIQPADRRQAGLKETCEDMEALFLKQLLSEMRRAGGTALRGPGGEMYQELFDQELARHLARSGDLGVAGMVREQIERPAGSTSGQEIAAGTGSAGLDEGRGA